MYAYDEADQNLHAALALLEGGTEKLRFTLDLFEEIGDVCRLSAQLQHGPLLITNWPLKYGTTCRMNQMSLRCVLHRKIVEIATETKWSVDAETYQQVGEISQESQTWLHASLQTMEGEPPNSETVHSLVAMSVDAWRGSVTPPDWESAQQFAQAAVTMAEQLDDALLLSQSSWGALANDAGWDAASCASMSRSPRKDWR